MLIKELIISYYEIIILDLLIVENVKIFWGGGINKDEC